MINIKINNYKSIEINNNTYEIYLYIYESKTELTNITVKIQECNLYLNLVPSNQSRIIYEKNIKKKLQYYDDFEPIKCTFYISNFTLNKDIVYLNFYFIYMIHKFYSHKIKVYYYILDGIKSYKKFNTMNLYKNVALII
jgi:hypothetical protein